METPGRKLPGPANPARGDAPHAKQRPAAPPAYRPQNPPVVLQPKAAGGPQRPPSAGQARRAPQAPPVYRPQPTPKVLQKKASPGLRAGAAVGVTPPNRRPGPVIQRATLVVQEAEHYDASILKDAKLFHQNHGTGVFYDDHARQALGDMEKKTVGDTRVDIFGHGNAGGVGDYDEDALVAQLKQLMPKLKLKEIRTIRFHSCDSAAPLSLEGASQSLKKKYEGKEGTALAERVAKKFLDENIYIEVSGFTGHTQTDLQGKSRVLKDPSKETEYRQKRDLAYGKEDWDKVSQIEDAYLHPAGDTSVEVSCGRELMLIKIGRSGKSRKEPALDALQYEVKKAGGNEWDEKALSEKARELFEDYRKFIEDELWPDRQNIDRGSQDYQDIISGAKRDPNYTY